MSKAMETFMRTIQVAGMVLVLMMSTANVHGQEGQPFEPGCATLPFEDIKGQNLTIDSQCGIDGTAEASSANAIQNEVKNNFCAHGTPVTLTFGDFDRLQAAAKRKKIEFGKAGLPSSRKALRNILTLNDGTKV